MMRLLMVSALVGVRCCRSDAGRSAVLVLYLHQGFLSFLAN
jgi:hypothetical protein